MANRAQASPRNVRVQGDKAPRATLLPDPVASGATTTNRTGSKACFAPLHTIKPAHGEQRPRLSRRVFEAASGSSPALAGRSCRPASRRPWRRRSRYRSCHCDRRSAADFVQTRVPKTTKRDCWVVVATLSTPIREYQAGGEYDLQLQARFLVGAAGLEPATLCLEGRCSIHLSYAPSSRVPADAIRKPSIARRVGSKIIRTPEPILVGSATHDVSSDLLRGPRRP